MVKKEKNKSSKKFSIFKLLSLVTFVLMIVFILVPFVMNKQAIKNYTVVKGVYELNKTLVSQYDNLSTKLINKIDVSKYTSKIDIPEIKLDKITSTTNKVSKGASMLSAFGVKGAGDIADTSKMLSKEVDKINVQIKNTTVNIQKNLEADINKALKAELSGLGKSEMQKQLGLSSVNYKNLVAGKYGVFVESEKKSAKAIFDELSKNKSDTVKNAIKTFNDYFNIAFYVVAGILFIIILLPVIILYWIGSKLNSFVKCPYCKRVFPRKLGKIW